MQQWKNFRWNHSVAIVLILLFSFLKKRLPFCRILFLDSEFLWIYFDILLLTASESWIDCSVGSAARGESILKLWGRARQLDMGCCIAMCLAGQKRTPVSAKSRPVCSSTTWLFHVPHLNKRLGFTWAFFTSRPHRLIPVGNGSARSLLLTQHLLAISAQV